MTTQHLALLRAIRAKTGESDTKLAARLSVSQVTVSRWFRRVDQPHHNQRLKIESVARRLGILKGNDTGNAPVVGVIKTGGIVEWHPSVNSKQMTDAVAGLVALVYVGPPSPDGFIQSGCLVSFEATRIEPDVTTFGKPCIVFPVDGSPPLVGVMRSKASRSKRDRTFRLQLIGLGTEVSVAVGDIALVRRIEPN